MAEYSAFAYASNSGTAITWGGTTQWTLDSYGQIGIAITTGSYPSVNVITDIPPQYRHSVSGSGYTFFFTDTFTFVQNLTYYIYFYFCTTTSITANLFGTATVTYIPPVPQITVQIKNYCENGLISDFGGSVTLASGNKFLISTAGTNYQGLISRGYTFRYFTLASESHSVVHDSTYEITVVSGEEVNVFYYAVQVPVTIYNYDTSGTIISGQSGLITKGEYGTFRITDGGTNYQGLTGLGYRFQYFTLSTESHSIQHTDTSYNIPVRVGLSVNAYYLLRPVVGYFYWTGSDASDQVNIASNQPITNLTAIAWRNLIDKLSAIGGATTGLTQPQQGNPITAAIFNEVRNVIANLGQSVTSSVTSNVTQILATQFANDYYALKEATNRAIDAYNNS